MVGKNNRRFSKTTWKWRANGTTTWTWRSSKISEKCSKKANEAQKEVKELNQERVLMVQMMIKNGMSVSQIAKSISKSEEEIKKWIS